MTEEEWLTGEHPFSMLVFLRGNASERKFRLFTVICCRAIWSEPSSGKRSRRAVELLELLADGLATVDDLRSTTLPPVTNFGCEDGDSNLADYFLTDSFQMASNGLFFGRVGDCDDVEQVQLLRDIFGNPFRPVAFDPAWRTETAVGIAFAIYVQRAFERMPILADALQDAGCEHPDILAHCREPGVHVRGCWVVDLLLGKS